MNLSRLGLRAACIAGAAGAVLWSACAFGALPDDGSLEHMADRIARGEMYGLDTLEVMNERTSAWNETTCDARFLTDAMIVQSKALDLQFAAGKLDVVDASMDRLGRTASRLVHCNPTSSFGWLGLYWVTSVRNGFQGRDLVLLENSYSTGLRESWISLRRNRLAFAVFNQLTPDLQDIVLDEFVDLVRVSQLDQAAVRFVAFNADVQRRLLDRLTKVPDPITWGLYKKLRHLGYEGGQGVGQPRRPDEPWID